MHRMVWLIVVLFVASARGQEEMLERPMQQCIVSDALGSAIPNAMIRLEFPGNENEPPARMDLQTDETGAAAIPPRNRQPSQVRVTHADYGVASAEMISRGDGRYDVRVPLVKRGTEAADRAVRGVVKGAKGEPLVGAKVTCSHVRTPGDGLIQAYDPVAAYADDKGEFALYVTDRSRRRDERGELIPPNSRFAITVEPTHEKLFPHIGVHTNDKPVEIVIAQPAKEYQIDIESKDGGVLKHPARGSFALSYHSAVNKDIYGQLPPQFVAGGYLPEGTYKLSMGGLEYEPLVISADSPRQLQFKLKPGTVYHGRVIDPLTQKPFANALVLGLTAIADGNLARLTDAEWKEIGEIPHTHARGDARLASVRRSFHFVDAARTNDAGEYSIHCPPGESVYSILAVAKDWLPIAHRVYALKPDDKRRAPLPDLPLYAAAKVIVTPKSTDSLSINARWIFADAKSQPEWFKGFQALRHGSIWYFSYDPWLKLNEPQPVYVPAGLKLRMRFEAPYEDEWSPLLVERDFFLEKGQSLDLGEVKLTPSIKISVRVVGPDGAPVEGVPLRRKHELDDAWSVAHNSDAQGMASFWIFPGQKVRVAATDLKRVKEAEAPGVAIDGKPGTDIPEVRLTEAEVQTHLNSVKK